MFGLVCTGLDLIRQNMVGGGGRVTKRIMGAIPCEAHDVELHTTADFRRHMSGDTLHMPGAFHLIRQWLEVAKVTDRSTAWAAARKHDGIISVLGMPPGRGDMPRYLYAHRSPWGMNTGKWHRRQMRRVLHRMHERRLPGCQVWCNAQWVCDDYVRHGAEARVIHPPCVVDTYRRNDERKGAMSVGRLVPQKGHDMAADICRMAGAELTVYGSGVRTQYGSATVHVNAFDAAIASAALNAKCVISGCHIEDFGIAVVEAVAAGCIPVVPDLYGFRETIPYDELRYAPHDTRGAARILRGVLAGSYDNLIPGLVSHMRQYGAGEFDARVRSAVRH